MALNWIWDEKCGELTFSQNYKGEEYREFTVSLYQGNAVLIMLNEWEEEHEDGIHNMWSMWNFFCDKGHMNRCLGLEKNSDGVKDNIFDKDTCRFLKIRLNKAKNRYWKDIVKSFASAFDNITIELYSEVE